MRKGNNILYLISISENPKEDVSELEYTLMENLKNKFGFFGRIGIPSYIFGPNMHKESYCGTKDTLLQRGEIEELKEAFKREKKTLEITIARKHY